MPDEELLPPPRSETETLPNSEHWHEVFREAASCWLLTLGVDDLLLLGLRWRYRLSQREVAQLLGVHEGTISRRISQLRDRCLDYLTQRLEQAGWTGEDISVLLYQEMGQVLLESPRCSARALAQLLTRHGLTVSQDSSIS
ncbi:hypothetical protein HRbin36_02106 [bacterium HR36]|nr:hypothetical protein HRbin36_02106 [bacterium HR36]